MTSRGLSGHKMRRKRAWVHVSCPEMSEFLFPVHEGETVILDTTKLLKVMATHQLEGKGPQWIINVFAAFLGCKEESLHICWDSLLCCLLGLEISGIDMASWLSWALNLLQSQKAPRLLGSVITLGFGDQFL